jgi:hypothetical protein
MNTILFTAEAQGIHFSAPLRLSGEKCKVSPCGWRPRQTTFRPINLPPIQTSKNDTLNYF